jgi:8-amino-7-oxononanoate synthase
MGIDMHFAEGLKILRSKGLLRTVRDRSSPQGPRIRIGNKEAINFASNDYLGLANDPEIIEAAKIAMDEFGFGGGAARLLSGGTLLNRRLEEFIAGFKGTEAAVTLNSGYAANTGIIPSIAGDGDLVFSDSLNHASVIDGCRLSRARTLIYRHRDIGHLESLMNGTLCAAEAKGISIVVTDTVFSMEGDIAPLPDLRELCMRKDAFLFLDDAHGTGVLGKGKGALAHFAMSPEDWIIQMGTFSKALGSFGAFAACSGDVIEWIKNTARGFIFSSALPAPAAAASLKALSLVEERPALLQTLWDNRDRLVRVLMDEGFVTRSETPIIPLKTKSVEDALKASDFLFEKGIYVPAIRPPAVREPRLRVTVTAAHSCEDIDSLIDRLCKIKTFFLFQ